MNFLLLNQCFYPDVAATGQYLTDLALELIERGHQVTVVTSDRGYNDSSQRFPRRETWRGIEIIRIHSLGLGKKTKWRRALNFGSFILNCALRLALLPRFDVVVALTSPPLISFLGSLFVQLKGGQLFFWVMDLNPDEAIAAGWLKESSLIARVLELFLRHSLQRAEKVIVLDRFVKERIIRKGISDQKVTIIPPWALDNTVRYDEQGRRAFRLRHRLSESFLVMYAGNHSPCHPLETLLEAARELSDRREIAFCFAGGGSEHEKVKAFADRHKLDNIHCLPYQPLADLSGSLSAADLHVVVMGEQFAGIVHPCKIYNILVVGSPFLYIGPAESHITDIAGESAKANSVFMTRHGDVRGVVEGILEAEARSETRPLRNQTGPAQMFSRQLLLPTMIDLFERASAPACMMTATQLSDYRRPGA